MTASRPERPVRPEAPRHDGPARLSPCERRALQRPECDLADDTRLRNWYAQLDLDTPASGHDNPRPGRTPEPGHAYRADSRVSRFPPSSPRLIGTTLVILSTLAHSPAAAVIGLILARCTHRQEAARHRRPRPARPANGWTAHDWMSGMEGGIWLLP